MGGAVTDLGDHASDLHADALDWTPPAVTVTTLQQAYAGKLTDLNRRHLLNGGTSDLQLQDPRDLVARLESMCAAIRTLTGQPRMDQADAIGAYALALGLSIARVEDQRLELGDAA